jgi:hypothetical protein
MFDRLIAAQLTVVAYVTAGLDRVRADDRQRGVVSVEYIVLGAAIIALVGFLANNGAVKQALETAFSGLFEKAGG